MPANPPEREPPALLREAPERTQIMAVVTRSRQIPSVSARAWVGREGPATEPASGSEWAVTFEWAWASASDPVLGLVSAVSLLA